MANELVEVPFHGDVIEATDVDGEVFVPLRRPCESLGLAPNSQITKLKGKPWARGMMIISHDPTGRAQEMYALHLGSFPLWLATIDTRRVKKESRPKLELYQTQAAMALAAWFFERPPAKRAIQIDPAALEAATERIASAIEARLADITGRSVEPRYTISDRLEAMGWHSYSGRDRDRVRNLALAMLHQAGCPRPVTESRAPGAELLFPASQCHMVDEAILRIWEEVRTRELRTRQPALPFAR